MKRPHLVFDLDGTLVDSAPDIHAAVARMLAEEGQAALDLATVTSFVGNGLPKLVERVIAHVGMDMAQHPRLTKATLDHYNAASSDLTRPYPGVVAVLSELQAAGHVMAICTNKPVAPARAILRDLGLQGFFSVVIGGDSLPVTKPDPAPLHACIAALGGGPVIYIGDSEVDAATAAAAGVPFALFTEGYRKTPVADLPHDVAFSDFHALSAVLADMRLV
ncbi:MAG: phosphoglycolate phosphatase [Pseudotabrizicola sp.]|uniref:phosphoglycolate phosphatase n=1 Tax=Pseudotabrizicola sp. TaxID=2939647 RepID=UPI002715C295|nr:phosphoglycolate phosphatase [Pseudotabrizicola sp.]MDO8885074.1 phosphoglycolate phosphatase [Pseudotabrizicola sp.]MDP2083302.1 phosphoglycolate phosphatase [Pseudotabrizicola sp.]MDZ7575895.1 phosphoglycolate phosphatase [Pseudotabrizicola sp.]